MGNTYLSKYMVKVIYFIFAKLLSTILTQDSKLDLEKNIELEWGLVCM